MSRRQARENAMKILYSNQLNKPEDPCLARDLFLTNFTSQSADLDYFDLLTKGVKEKTDLLDKIVSPRLSGWTLDRIPLVDLTIMRIALFEILFREDIPNNVAISEAVRLAKTYSDDASRIYINAVLGSVNRDLCQLLEDNPDLDTEGLVDQLCLSSSQAVMKIQTSPDKQENISELDDIVQSSSSLEN